MQPKALDCFFVSDLHGQLGRYEKLFKQLLHEKPAALFIGGDILPSPYAALRNGYEIPFKDFINEYLVPQLKQIKETLGNSYPRIFVILGNDDARREEEKMLAAAQLGIWEYCHNRSIRWENFTVYGYTYIPPSPFRLKDWEHFDVTDYVRPGCFAPTDPKGVFTVPIDIDQLNITTIEEDLKKLTGNNHLNNTIFLFHSPPHRCKLDRAALDNQRINDIQVDVHVGSVAIQRFIARRQPLLTLHGHIHESTRLTGSWQETFNSTTAFNASHDGPELALIRFNPHCPHKATRQLI